MALLVLTVIHDREAHAVVRMVCEHRGCVPLTARDAPTARRMAAADRPHVIVCAPVLARELREIVPEATIISVGALVPDADHYVGVPLDAAAFGDMLDARLSKS